MPHEAPLFDELGIAPHWRGISPLIQGDVITSLRSKNEDPLETETGEMKNPDSGRGILPATRVAIKTVITTGYLLDL